MNLLSIAFHYHISENVNGKIIPVDAGVYWFKESVGAKQNRKKFEVDIYLGGAHVFKCFVDSVLSEKASDTILETYLKST